LANGRVAVDAVARLIDPCTANSCHLEEKVFGEVQR